MENQNRIETFKATYKKFKDALSYVNKNIEQLKQDPKKWQNIQSNFKTKFEEPMNQAWQDLSKQEQRRYGTLYLFRKEIADEEWERIIKVAEMFHGRVVSIDNFPVGKNEDFQP